jgi:ribonuclease BN (tRNA processing enzyme)
MRAFAYSTNLFPRDSGIPDPRILLRIHEVDVPDVGRADRAVDGAVHRRRRRCGDGECGARSARSGVSCLRLPLHTPEGSVVFSGDTAASENVVRLVHGADVLVHEVIDIGVL